MNYVQNVIKLSSMKTFIIFLKFWFQMIPECWNDAKIVHDKKCQQSFKDLCNEIDLDQQYID